MVGGGGGWGPPPPGGGGGGDGGGWRKMPFPFPENFFSPGDVKINLTVIPRDSRSVTCFMRAKLKVRRKPKMRRTRVQSCESPLMAFSIRRNNAAPWGPLHPTGATPCPPTTTHLSDTRMPPLPSCDPPDPSMRASPLRDPRCW